MTRFKKEMMVKFPKADWDGMTDTEVYVVEEEALVVFSHPSIVTVLRVLANGKQREVTEDYPRISAPYLVHLCGGDEDKAREILRKQRLH